jgi:hypothetical protein
VTQAGVEQLELVIVRIVARIEDHLEAGTELSESAQLYALENLDDLLESPSNPSGCIPHRR